MKIHIAPLLAAALLLGARGFAQSPSPTPTPDYTSAIRTPPPPPTPRINGPRIYGERPGHPFFYHLPVSGERPITVTAEGLPAGLTLDPATGNITGVISQPGQTDVKFTAVNAAGKESATLRIVCGPTVCLTPPLGWNSWNAFHRNIDEGKIKGAADAMVATGLIDHGWTYINMDDRWEGKRDANGNIQGGPNFPDMKGLADYIHAKGLKVGLYSSPGPTTCAGAAASYQHEDQDAATYASWDMDYLKYDWCSYGGIADKLRAQKYRDILPPDQATQLSALTAESAVLNARRHNYALSTLPQTDDYQQAEAKSATLTTPQIIARQKEVQTAVNALIAEAKKLAPDKSAAVELELLQEPYAKMRASLDKVNRDIVFSFCQYGRGQVWEWGAATGGNLWRTTGDIGANWKSVESHGFGQNGHEKWAGPGHWNDPDMLEIGNGKLTPDENYTHMTLWCMLDAPLLIGCDMPKMTPFTISLFTNDEVLAVNQDSLGKQGWRAKQDGSTEVWMKPLADGSLAVAFFNRGEAPANVSVQWSDLKLSGPQAVRDLWRQKGVGNQASGYSVNVASHGAELFKVTPAKGVAANY
jgi:alpha-galactosidase